jgi:hypothetical protein
VATHIDYDRLAKAVAAQMDVHVAELDTRVNQLRDQMSKLLAVLQVAGEYITAQTHNVDTDKEVSLWAETPMSDVFTRMIPPNLGMGSSVEPHSYL